MRISISEVHQIYLERMGTGHGVESKVSVAGGGQRCISDHRLSYGQNLTNVSLSVVGDGSSQCVWKNKPEYSTRAVNSLVQAPSGGLNSSTPRGSSFQMPHQ